MDRDLYAVLRFSRSGWLEAVYINAPTKEGELILIGRLTRMLKPSVLSWLCRLFRFGGQNQK